MHSRPAAQHASTSRHSPVRRSRSCNPGAREDCSVAYDAKTCNIIHYGGWKQGWLDDLWCLNVAGIVGPPYAVQGVFPICSTFIGAIRRMQVGTSSYSRIKRFIDKSPEPWADHATLTQQQKQRDLYFGGGGGGKGGSGAGRLLEVVVPVDRKQKSWGVRVSDEGIVIDIWPGSMAACEDGLELGDVILEVDGFPVSTKRGVERVTHMPPPLLLLQRASAACTHSSRGVLTRVRSPHTLSQTVLHSSTLRVSIS